MEAIARALILATQYIEDRSEDHALEDDVRILESAASILSEATFQEKEMLIKIARELGFPKWPEEIGIE